VREDEPGDQRLVAYVVPEAESLPLAEEVKEHLRMRLPEYMIPSAIVTIEQIPLTVNGKLDISALPKPDALASVSITSSEDEVSMQLEVIWQEILKVSPIGHRQSFFELGGHSLLAIRLVKRIEEQFGRELPLAAVFEASTIEQMSELLRREYRPTQSSHLVPMQTRGSNRPIFFIHPGGGGVGAYREIAKLLGEDQPFYALQALDEEENKLETVLSVEDRAARYIEAIQTIDSVGPYILGGWSMGGFIAYEMAQQIKRQGKEISNLFLLDIVARNESSLASSGDEADEFLAVTKEMSTTVFSLEAVKGKSLEQRLQYLLEQLIAEKVLSQEVTVPLVRGFLKGLRRRNQSMIDYKLLPYDGAVTLIRAEQGKALGHKEIDPADVTSGFSALCPKIDVAFVPGNHYDLMVSPNAEKLVHVIQRILGEFPKREFENKVSEHAAV
jgi:thioesterase domain-containing protein/acyl carrier protein